MTGMLFTATKHAVIFDNVDEPRRTFCCLKCQTEKGNYHMASLTCETENKQAKLTIETENRIAGVY